MLKYFTVAWISQGVLKAFCEKHPCPWKELNSVTWTTPRPQPHLPHRISQGSAQVGLLWEVFPPHDSFLLLMLPYLQCSVVIELTGPLKGKAVLATVPNTRGHSTYSNIISEKNKLFFEWKNEQQFSKWFLIWLNEKTGGENSAKVKKCPYSSPQWSQLPGTLKVVRAA